MMRVIVLEEGADLDALSGALAFLKLDKNSYLFKPRYLSRKAGKVFKDFKYLFRIIEELPEKFSAVLIDTQHLPEYVNRECIEELIVYDHHPKEIENFRGKIDKVGSATTLVVEELMKSDTEISPEEATVISLGIYEDTGNLTYEGTTERDLRALEWLFRKGVDLKTVRKYIHESFTKEQISAVNRIVSSVEKIFLGDKVISIATAKLEKYQPDINPLLYEIKDLKDANAFFVIIEAEGKTYVFGRSQDEDIDAGKILSVLGGGGHPEAGALKLENVSAERIKTLLEKVIKGEVKPSIRIRDIMTSPPFVLRSSMTVEEALKELSDMGFAGAPVLNENNELEGLIFKKDLIKLSRLYPGERIENFLIKDFHTLSPEDPVWYAEDILSKFGQKMIPVVEEGKVVGVVTRIDILRKIKEDLEDIKAFRKRIEVPENIREISQEVGRIAKDLGFKAYLVGGCVRDILLKKEVWDLDFVIEGDAVKVAKELADKYGVPFHPFEEFKTAHLKIGNFKIEFATARREKYERPGAYPVVENASIKEDLLRRDFTINALALSVNPEDFGTIIDFFGGLRDLKEGIIRILHPLSFIEDPVRILRALRFAGRFGFKLSKSTEKLLKQAVDLHILKEAPKGRIMNEIKLALREDKFPDILMLYRKYRILEEIIEGFYWSYPLEERLLKLKKVIDWHSLQFPEEKIDYGWLYIPVLLTNAGKGRALEFLSDMGAPSWVREATKFMFERFRRTLKALEEARENYDIYKILRPLRVQEMLLLMTEESVRDKVKKHLEVLRFVKVPKEEIEKLKAQGLKGRELGERIEMKKKEIMNSL